MTAGTAPAVRVRGVTKRFPGVVANSDVSFDVARGEVHAVVGENGAGKSTLMKILYGMQRPDSGTLEVDGREVRFRSPSDAIEAGIGMVHQHFMLADNLTVLENVVLGSEPTRGSTIMLNTIAVGLGAYLLTTHFAERVEGSLNVATPELPPSARVPALDAPADALLGLFGTELPRGRGLYGFLLVAVVVGVFYAVLVERTRFGFELRATGLSPSAATASGIDAGRMTLATMLLSGALAGLVGMPYLLSESGRYSLDFPPGLGFAGIGIALLGRNSPVGMALAALLFAFLDRSSAPLQLEGIPPEIAVIMQGTIVLSVVVAYEVVRRARLRQAERDVRAASEAEGRPAVGAGASA